MNASFSFTIKKKIKRKSEEFGNLADTFVTFSIDFFATKKDLERSRGRTGGSPGCRERKNLI